MPTTTLSRCTIAGRRFSTLLPAVTVALVIPVVVSCRNDSEPEPNVPVQEVLQRILDDAVDQPDVLLAGAVLHYRHPAYAPWSGAAGWGDTEANVAMRPHDKFRAGSILKPFVAAVVLQHVEAGTLALEQTLPELLPQDVTESIANADRITLRMLLNHTSGIPEWLTAEVLQRIVTEPTHTFTAGEYLDIAAELPASFEPGTSWSYSNTNYTVLGLVIEQATEQDWRVQIRERIIQPLGLDDTSLPEPGDTSIEGDYAHGYQAIAGDVIDFTNVDPSMAGAAGGHALVTTAEDLGRFLDALLAGGLFSEEATLTEMMTMVEAMDESGLPHRYGLGIASYTLPDGTEVIGHGGGTAGYSTMMFHAPAYDTTIVASSNTGDYFANALQVFIPAVSAAIEKHD